jgi:geranylgeranyl diphosphate synthase, type II
MMTTSPSNQTSTADAGQGGIDAAERERLSNWLGDRRAVIDEALARLLPPPTRWPAKLHEAMCWSLFGGGKRLRPLLALAAFEAVGGRDNLSYDAVLPAACAVEMIHTYSLIHDDLPCMDDDDERRGRATCHKRYGEGLALLAGDALLTEAFRVALDPQHYRGLADPQRITSVAMRLAQAAGMSGMVGGQSSDLGFEGAVSSEAEVTFLHRRKTGELFSYALFAGATLGGGNPEQVRSLSKYGETLGLAFQVADDLLDARQDVGQRAPDADETPSFPALLGEEESWNRALELEQQAHKELEGFGERGELLALLVSFAVHRDH